MRSHDSFISHVNLNTIVFYCVYFYLFIYFSLTNDSCISAGFSKSHDSFIVVLSFFFFFFPSSHDVACVSVEFTP